jgi:hypothetical protein
MMVLVKFFEMAGVIKPRAILKQYIAALLCLDRDAWVVPEPGCINQVSRRDRIGFLENFCRVLVDALELDNRWRLEFLWRLDV